MTLRTIFNRYASLLLAFTIAACGATSSASLQTGMTPDEAAAALGQPDLKDAVPDPNNRAATLLRYTWVGAGKAAIFGPNNRLVKVEAFEAAARQPEHEPQLSVPFDPINTPINYAFYPLRAAFIYIGAGINCVAQGQCQKPRLPSPNAG